MNNIMKAMQTQQMKSKYNNSRRQKKSVVDSAIYAPSMITRSISISIISIGQNLDETIRQKIQDDYEGKCVVEGFIKPGSSKIVSYSSGTVRGGNIIFEVLFECETSLPVEGMKITCVAVNITKAGIRGDIANIKPSPAIVFITRDHHYNVDYFNTIKEGDIFVAIVIGQRFELNDKFVSIIAKLETSDEYKRTMKYQQRRQITAPIQQNTVKAKSYYDLEESPELEDIAEENYLEGIALVPPPPMRKKKGDKERKAEATEAEVIISKKPKIDLEEESNFEKVGQRGMRGNPAEEAIDNPPEEYENSDEEEEEEEEEEDAYIGVNAESQKKARFEDSDED